MKDLIYESSDELEPCTSGQGRMPEYSSTEEDASDCEPVQLQPFIHQVGGHSCVLRFNETTLCKPLIQREHFFYESMPVGLKEFVPVYRGIIEVQLQEDDDGSITLVGYPLTDPQDPQRTGGSQRGSPKGFDHAHSPVSSGSENESSQSPVLRPRHKHVHVRSSSDSYSVRLLRSGSIEVSSQTDTVFHSPDPKSGQRAAGLNPWSLKCHKRQLAKMRTDNQESNLKQFILLENVAAKFSYPCILDLKMGTRQHGDDAPESKKTSQMRKCANTTSSAVGVRLIGMQVYQSSLGQFVCQNKYYGRKLTVDGFRDILEVFLFDGEKLRTELLDPILIQLKQLYKVIQKQESFRFYSSSLLIMYGGRDQSRVTNKNNEECMATIEGYNNKESQSSDVSGQVLDPLDSDSNAPRDDACLVDVRMIDFAHSTHQGFTNDAKHVGVDQGYLFGLQNLILIFEDIKKKYSREPDV